MLLSSGVSRVQASGVSQFGKINMTFNVIHIPSSRFILQYLIQQTAFNMNVCRCCLAVLALHILLDLIAALVKVKFTLEQATKAQTGSRGIALLFL